jgi:hypothetical protein
MTNYTLPKKHIDTVNPSIKNEITKKYYWFLVGEINRGVIQKAVCRINWNKFNDTRYYLISY